MATKIPKRRGRPRNFDRDEALDTALKLFWRHGYEGTSIATLAEAIGISIPSLYLAFGNKERLFLRVVEHYDRYGGLLYEHAFRQTSAREIMRAVLLGEVELVAGRETPDGCLMVQGALATSPDSDTVRQALAKLRRQAEADVADHIERAGDLPKGWDAKALACYVITVASGMAVQAKSGVSREELLTVADVAMLIWPDG